MVSEVPDESNGSAVGPRGGDFLLTPVSPCAYGEGLPYAPIDWPNLGDIWKWRVGSKISKSGHYIDRYLYPPSSLPKCGVKRSKASVEHYLRTEFPGAGVNAFFDSFSWRIPSKMHSWTTCNTDCAKAGREIKEDGEKGKSMSKGNGKGKYPRKRKQRPPELSPTRKLHTRRSWKQFLSSCTKDIDPLIDLTMEEEESSSDLISNSNSTSEVHDLNVESPPEVTGEDFDEYIRSLEDIITQPPANIAPTLEELDGARTKLSSLLSMDFPSLISSNHFAELSTLCWTLRKDPSLSADQVSMLRLIEEIRMTSKGFLEATKIIEQADEFLANFEVKLAKATSLRDEYNVAKEKESILKAEVGSDLLAIEDIDNQISQLQSRQAEIVVSIKNKKKAVDELVAVRKRMNETLPAMVREIQVASTKRMEWEMKKEESVQYETEMLSKFAPLKGFSL